MPEDARLHELATASSSDDKGLSDVTKFDQLMAETRAVISRYVYQVASSDLGTY